jgi:tetratricopeptide (TPR) repeat protein
MRLDWKRVDDDVGTLAALDRIAAQRPSVAAQAVLAAALLEALGGRVEPALARVEAASVSSLDLRLLRADLLSRLGRDEEALAALPEVAAADPQAHAAAALRVAILHRAGRLGEAASEALALADLASTPALWGVPSAFARAIAVLLADDAGDAALLELARERLGADATHVADLARRGISRPAQWFLLAHASPDRLGTLGAPQARTGR